MFCPACGKRAQAGAFACAGCAIVFSKWTAGERAFLPPPPPGVRTPAAWGACVAAGVLLFALRAHFRGAFRPLDGVDRVFHEAGRSIVGLFGGHFPMMLGGAALQLFIPIAFAVDFRRRGHARSSDACAAWAGQNLLHIGRYAADAEVGRAFDFAGCLVLAWACLSIWERTRAPKF